MLEALVSYQLNSRFSTVSVTSSNLEYHYCPAFEGTGISLPAWATPCKLPGPSSISTRGRREAILESSVLLRNTTHNDPQPTLEPRLLDPAPSNKTSQKNLANGMCLQNNIYFFSYVYMFTISCTSLWCAMSEWNTVKYLTLILTLQYTLANKAQVTSGIFQLLHEETLHNSSVDDGGHLHCLSQNICCSCR